MKRGTQIEVKIINSGFGGIGIGLLTESFLQNLKKLGKHPENYTTEIATKKVIVEDAIPDEVILASVERSKSNFIEAVKIKIIEKSPISIDPKCVHYEICGGCNWQKLKYKDQIEMKQGHILDSFTRIGGFKKEDILKKLKKTNTAKNEWNYRNKVEFTFGFDENFKPTLGYHAKGKKYDIFELKECHLTDPVIVEIAKTVFKTLSLFPPYRFQTNKGILRNLVIRKAQDEIMVNLITANGSASKRVISYFLNALKPFKVASTYHTEIFTEKGVKTKIRSELVDGKETITEKITIDDKEFMFELSPLSFFQTNTEQAENMFKIIKTLIKPTAKDTILDLFCGTGAIGITLAPFVKEVIGIEINESSIDDAIKNAKINNLNNIEFIHGDVGGILEGWDFSGNLEDFQGHKIVLDPPRAGLTPKMLDYVLKLKPSEIVYVSCNPTTHARDIKYLSENGYKLKSLTPLDMFPQTYHIESVALLTK